MLKTSLPVLVAGTTQFNIGPHGVWLLHLFKNYLHIFIRVVYLNKWSSMCSSVDLDDHLDLHFFDYIHLIRYILDFSFS